METDRCRYLELRSGHSPHWQWIFPRLAFDLSTRPALLFERAVLPLILVSDLNRPGVFRTVPSTIQELLEDTMPQQLGIR